MKYADSQKTILTDVDGVLLNWEYAFDNWLDKKGYVKSDPHIIDYDRHVHYDMEKADMKKLIREFNNSSVIGYLPPLRDAVHFVRALNERKGYVFHAITSLSEDSYSQKLRIMNMENVFGPNIFDKYIFLDTGEDKDEVLKEYEDSGLLWVEDKPENALVGLDLGLNAGLMCHNHNKAFNVDPPINCHNGMKPYIPIYNNWEEIYDVM